LNIATHRLGLACEAQRLPHGISRNCLRNRYRN